MSEITRDQLIETARIAYKEGASFGACSIDLDQKKYPATFFSKVTSAWLSSISYDFAQKVIEVKK